MTETQPSATIRRPMRKYRVGRVVSDKMQKTVVVEVSYTTRHRIYKRTLRRTRRYKAHDEENACKIGDTVRMIETRPISKDKHWKVIEILRPGADLPELAEPQVMPEREVGVSEDGGNAQ